MKVNVSGVRSPHFGAGGQILVQQTEGNTNYLEQINSDGSHRSKIFPYPIGEFQSVSPGRRWVMLRFPGRRKPTFPRSWQFRWPTEPRSAFARPTA